MCDVRLVCAAETNDVSRWRQSKSPVSVLSSPSSELEQFDALSQRTKTDDPFDLTGLGTPCTMMLTAEGSALNSQVDQSNVVLELLYINHSLKAGPHIL